MAATTLANELFDVTDSYAYELVQLWPNIALQQSLLLVVVWIHSCIGLHFWLRLTDWYQRAFPVLFALAVLIPCASLAGFMVAGKAVTAAVADPLVMDELRQQTNWPSDQEISILKGYSAQAINAFYLVLAAVLLMILGRWIARRFSSKVSISYVPDPTVRANPGPTLLEISRAQGIPHLSVCGGRARCSTCRVEIVKGAEILPPPEGAEAKTLASIAAGPRVRLACQVRPTGPVTVNLLLQPEPRARGGSDQGVEQTLAVLFLDARDFTSWSQDKLPYDVVFILNRLFNAAGQAIESHGGWIDKYLGDGLMAVFGRHAGPEAGCRHALEAARAIDMALDRVNRGLANELPAPIRVGMGIHVGPLVLGRLGHENTAATTVVGRTVNATSRLEALSKEKACQLVVSVKAARMAGLDLAQFKPEPVSVRGLDQPLDVICVDQARDLPDFDAG
jgi:adenylate cyclase